MILSPCGVEVAPLGPGAGEAAAAGDAERRDASITDSGTSPAIDWMEGDGRREGVGFSVTGRVPFVCLGSESAGWITGIVH